MDNRCRIIHSENSTIEMDEKVDNNNSFWNDDKSINVDEMIELGVDVLPSKNESLPERKKRERTIIKPEDIVYNEYSMIEAKEFEETHKAKYIKEDNFLFRQKPNPIIVSKDVFSSLSDEIILVIFKYLSHEDLKFVAQVNHRFRRLSHDESLWPRIDLSAKTLNSNTLAYIIKRGVKVLRLKEAKINSPIWQKSVGLKLFHFVSKIEYLDLSYCIISSEDLALFLSKCRNLRKLSLESCDVSNDVCKEVAKNRDLDTLDLAMATGLEPEGLYSICTGCTNLQHVNLSWTQLSKTSVKTFIQYISEQLLSLNISGDNLHAVNDSEIETLVRRCPRLTELDISDCLEISTSTLDVVARGLVNIRNFAISRCYKIDPKVLIGLLDEMNSLRSLNAFRVLGSQEARELEAKYSFLRVNKEFFSTVARPTVGVRRTSIWLVRCRE